MITGILAALVKQLAPMVIGPVVTSIVKWMMAKFGAELPALAKIGLSAAAGAVTAATTGNATILADAVTGGIAGVAGSKGRDVLVAKPEACATSAPGQFVPPWNPPVAD